MTENLDFLGGEVSQNKDSYNERKRYLDYFRSKDYALLDTLYDKKLYGFLSKKGHVVMPTPMITRFGEDSGTVAGLNYTVDFFNAMRRIYRNNDSIILPEKIPDLIPKRSYDNFEDGYNIYEKLVMETVIDDLVEKLDSRPVELLEFVEQLEEIIFTDIMVDLPMTKTGYALSSYSSAYYTGLYVDLDATKDGSLDLEKPSYFEDVNFDCYVKLAEESGFYVDANAPWRLVLNLESPIVKAGILNGRPMEEFDKFYYDVYTINVGYDDYWALRTQCQNLYIEYYRTIESPLEEMPRLEYSDRWLEFLLVNKFRELSLMLNISGKEDKEFTDVLKKAVDIKRIYGLTSNLGAIGYINDYFGKKIVEKIEEYKNITNSRYTEELQGHISNRLKTI